MAKYNVELYVTRKQCFDDVEADSKEEAIRKCKECKDGEVQVSLDKTYCLDEGAWEVK